MHRAPGQALLTTIFSVCRLYSPARVLHGGMAACPISRLQRTGRDGQPNPRAIHLSTDRRRGCHQPGLLSEPSRPGSRRAARYIIALDPKVGEKETQQFSDLPDSVELYRPKQLCFELGTVGEVLFSSGRVVLLPVQVRPFLHCWMVSRPA